MAKTFTIFDLSDDSEIFGRITELMENHARFLSNVESDLLKMSKANPEIFRRNPETRVKSLQSLTKKINEPQNTDSNLFERLKLVEDIAGIRLTIATKDLFGSAEKLIRETLENTAYISIKRDDGNDMIRDTGYLANHYIAVNKKDRNIKCEIQVRTLTQDLWAVFTHYESYKLPKELEQSRADEILNFARLMDVSDYYAKLIKDRKIYEADNLFKLNCHNSNSEKLLTVKILQEELYRVSSKNELDNPFTIEKIDIIKLCDILKELWTYQVYSVGDLQEVLTNEEYTSALKEVVENALDEQGIEREMDILTAFDILCKCRRDYKQAFKSKSITLATRRILRGYVDAWLVEAITNDKLDFIQQPSDTCRNFLMSVQKVWNTIANKRGQSDLPLSIVQKIYEACVLRKLDDFTSGNPPKKIVVFIETYINNWLSSEAQ